MSTGTPPAAVEMRHLRLVAAIVEQGSMTAAGRVLNLTQSALSHQLRELEARLRSPLFVRTSRRMVLTPAGDQLRVHNGLYLANWRLGRREAAAEAFDRLVDFGLRQRRLAVKFLFRPGSTAFWPDPEVSGPYGMWLERLARRAAASGACLELVGHTSASGLAAMNERLSLLRARYVEARLEAEAPELAPRTTARGAGARENLVGSGTDDAADALDRRVEFGVVDCGPAAAARQDGRPS